MLWPGRKGASSHTYQFHQLGAHDLHRENAVGAAPDGGSTSLPQCLQTPPASSHTGEVEGSEECLFCLALETFLCSLLPVSPPHLKVAGSQKLNLSY